MFYEPEKKNHGLPHDPFKGLVVPRPIGWIGSFAKDGTANLAPYSFFNAVCSQPPIVCFSSENYKDSVANIDEIGAFSCNLAVYDLKDQMNKSSASLARDVNEFEVAGLTQKTCNLINAPYVEEAPAILECIHLETRNLTDKDGNKTPSFVVYGQVVGIHIADRVINNGIVDASLLRPLARMGYREYTIADEPFEMMRPG